MVGVSGTGQYTVSESSRQNLRTRTPYRSCFIFFVSTNILKEKRGVHAYEWKYDSSEWTLRSSERRNRCTYVCVYYIPGNAYDIYMHILYQVPDTGGIMVLIVYPVYADNRKRDYVRRRIARAYFEPLNSNVLGNGDSSANAC